jgi:hypothetical protein
MLARPIVKYVSNDRLADVARGLRSMAERAITPYISDGLIQLTEQLEELAAQQTCNEAAPPAHGQKPTDG